jgi:large subunit ribosomal protein L22
MAKIAKDENKAKAIGKYLRVPADKARIMARAVVGLPAEAAVNALKFTPNKTARLILKVLNSALANATDTKKVANVDELFVSQIRVDRGPSMKRFQPCAHGRAKPILKRFSHITVVVETLGQKA